MLGVGGSGHCDVVWWHMGVWCGTVVVASAPAYLFNQYFKNLQGCEVQREKSLHKRRWMVLRVRGQ